MSTIDVIWILNDEARFSMNRPMPFRFATAIPPQHLQRSHLEISNLSKWLRPSWDH